MEPAQILEEAADNMFVFGWLQGRFGDRNGPRCAEGHIMKIETKEMMSELSLAVSIPLADYGFDPPQPSSARAVRDALLSHINRTAGGYGEASESYHGDFWPSIACWNDNPGRTEEEVREMFLGAAKELRNNAS